MYCIVCNKQIDSYWDSCSNCNAYFCSDECMKEFNVIRDGKNMNNKKVAAGNHSSCAFCRGEYVTDDMLYKFAIENGKIDKEKLKEEYLETHKAIKIPYTNRRIDLWNKIFSSNEDGDKLCPFLISKEQTVCADGVLYYKDECDYRCENCNKMLKDFWNEAVGGEN